MAITKHNKHDSHPVRIHLTKNAGPHYAALRCVLCNTHIQWLNTATVHTLSEMGVEIHNKTGQVYEL